MNNSARFAESLLHIPVLLVIPIPAHWGWLRWWLDLSPPTPRRGQAAPAGGALLPGWTSCEAPTEFEKCSGLPGTGPWTFSAPACPGKYRSGDVIRAEPSSWNQRWVTSLGRFGPVRVGELVELLNRVCQWDGGVPMTVAHYRERVGVKWIMPLKVWGLYFQLVSRCWCCFTPREDWTLCFIIVNFVVICIHRGLPSQTHHCWFSADENGTSGISLQSKS